MPTDPERPWETPEEAAAKEPAPPDTRHWAIRYRWWLVAAVIVAIIGAWTAWDASRSSERESAGYAACEEAIRDGLGTGYNPQIDVFFEEEQPSGAFAFSAYADDGDGQWTCILPPIGQPLDVDVIDGLVYDE